MLRLLYSFIFLFCMSAAALAQVEYLQVKALSGDGIIVLLGRYGLDRGECNIDLFCKLNKLTRNSHLMSGRSYFLPIEKHKYNGSSIRTSTGINDWHTAKQIERYNEMMCQFQLKSEDFRQGKRELWCPHHLRACTVDVEAFVPTNRQFPIFGKKLEYVPLKDKNLAGAVYYIISGHGGPDPGAMATHQGHKICEDEYAYDISLRLARRLLEHGAIVYMITQDKDGIREENILPCDANETVYENKTIPVDQKERLTQRSDLVNELYRKHKKSGIEYQRLIEIHVDSRSKSERIDLFFYYYPQSLLGKALAETMHKMVQEKYAKYRKGYTYSGDVSARDLHTLREVLPTPVFVELANIQNKSDQQRIVVPQNRQLLADWLAEGLMSDY